MMYANRFVCAVKVNGQILREHSNIVTIPFGAEYSVLLKNLNSVRAQAKVSVDGKDATEGTWLVLAPNSSLHLERYIRNGNLQAGNRFKFIERTGSIEKHRGVGGEDGLIRVEFKFEKVQPPTINVPRVHFYDEYIPVPKPWPYVPCPPWRPPYIWYGVQDNTFRSQTSGGSQFQSMMNAQTQTSNSTSNRASSSPSLGRRRPMVAPPRMRPTRSAPAGRTSMRPSASASRAPMRDLSDAGITVPGSASDQQFSWVQGFETEQSEVIVLQLRGEVGGKKVMAPVTVNHKPTCETCGKVNKGTAAFCSYCGTALSII